MDPRRGGWAVSLGWLSAAAFLHWTAVIQEEIVKHNNNINVASKISFEHLCRLLGPISALQIGIVIIIIINITIKYFFVLSIVNHNQIIECDTCNHLYIVTCQIFCWQSLQACFICGSTLFSCYICRSITYETRLMSM